MTDRPPPPDETETAAIAAFQLVQSLMRRLAESGAVPQEIIYGAVQDAVLVLESALDEGLMTQLNEPAAQLIRDKFPTAMDGK